MIFFKFISSNQNSSALSRFIFLFVFVASFNINVWGQKITGLDYISPKPNSKGIAVQSNIIIRFVEEINLEGDITAYFQIESAGILLPFHVVPQNDPKKLILKTNQDFAVNSEIVIKCLQPLHTIHQKILPSFQFKFYTHHKTYFEYVNNETSTTSTLPILPQPTLKEASNSNHSGTKILESLSLQPSFYFNMSQGDSNDFFLLGSMMAPNNANSCIIVNGLGEVVFDRKTPFHAVDFKMHEDSIFSFVNLAPIASDYCIIRMDKNFQIIDSIKPGNGYNLDIHELKRDYKTGHYFILAERIITVDMSQIVAGGFTEATLLDIMIQELDSNQNVVFEWKCFDHLPITDAFHVNLTSNQQIDWVHCNGIDLDTDTTLLLSSRHLNEVTRIDRRTGAIIWRLGTNASTDRFEFVNDEEGFTYQHDSQKLPNGNILLFDNGNFKSGRRHSRAVEYQLDEVTMKAEKVWEFNHDPDIGSDFMGSVQRLKNGNTVIGWGSAIPSLTEVDEYGNIVYEGSFPNGVLCYRVKKYNIRELIERNQPKFTLPDSFTICKLNDPKFDSKLLETMQTYVDPNVSTDYQIFNIKDNEMNMVLQNPNNHCYSFNYRLVEFDSEKMKFLDTTICSGKGIVPLSITPGCTNSTYTWSDNTVGSTTQYQTKDNLNRVFLTITNGLFTQTDSAHINVSPLEPFEVIGQDLLEKPFTVYSYSIPYIKDASYTWKAINGNVIGGFETNSVEVQWGNKNLSFIKGTITDSYGCSLSSDWDTIVYQSSSTGIEDLYETLGLKVFPSPFTEQITIDGAVTYSYVLYDISGKAVKEGVSSGKELTQIETTELQSGIYVLNLITDTKQVRLKLTKP
ncbi:MAG: aryl-sulfate sulfotransferase [Bacteroidia bacterium]|nr:aryl-sulfate sulfotransferase [Bacteroidia bacterium]MCF8427934.1 aryl-sulfate sulfotransferase [Bacteroidia bacterium]MCF8447966.1 aryl-sulfate sulfotransferase [Bacteroidia bacterium]